jgi:acyl-CoA synthetase (AMP-forming)/AMP-acid ligase II
MITLDRITELARRPGAGTAVIDAHGRLGWARLEARTRALVAELGPRGHRRVAFLSRNRADLIPVWAALTTLGVPFVGLDHTADVPALAACVRDLAPTCLVHAAELRHEAEAIRARTGVALAELEADLAAGEGHGGGDRGRDGTAWPVRPYESIHFSSGTTGRPKGVVHSVPFGARRAQDMAGRFAFDEGDVFAVTLPFFHVSIGWAQMVLGLGGTLVLSEAGDADRVFADVLEHGVTAMLVTPAVLAGVVAHVARERTQGRLRFVVVGGKFFPAGLKRRAVEVLGPIVTEYYGTTETGMNAMASSEEMLAFPNSAGRVLPGSRIAVVGPDGRPVAEGLPGRIAIDGYQNLDNYLSGPAETVELDGRRHVVTADTGYLRADRLYLMNRALAAPTAFDLYAIEDALRALPAVEDAFCVAPSPSEIRVFTCRSDDRSDAAIARVVEAVARGHAGVVVRHERVERIPYSPAGKVRVRELLGNGCA